MRTKSPTPSRIPLRAAMLCLDCDCISVATSTCDCGSTHTFRLAPVLNRTEPAKLRLVAGGMGIPARARNLRQVTARPGGGARSN